MGLCTKELVMFEVAMECYGNRFRTPLKGKLSDPTQMQLQDNTKRVHDRVVEDTRRYERKGDDDRCGVDRPTLITS